PSPGRANRPDVDVAILQGALSVAPPNPAPGEAVMLALRVANRGAAARPAQRDTLAFSGDALDAPLALPLPALAAGETLAVTQPVVRDSLALRPDSLALLAQDRAALLAAFAGLDALRVATVARWPSLNNTNAADGAADIVTLRERDGLMSDRVAYSASGVPA